MSTYHLEIAAVPTICSEQIANWKSVHQHLTKIAAPQVNQGVESKPQSLEWEIIAGNFFTIKLEFFARIVRDC